MIIDFHNHTYPDKIVAETVEKLSSISNTVPYTNGTAEGLSNDLKETNAFDFAKQVNAGDKKAHFYRGKNYKDDNAINEAYNNLTIFLDEKTSTLKYFHCSK